MDSVLWSAPESRRPGTHLVVMLHGYGSTEQRMHELFLALPEGATGVALRGPFAVGSDFGWFLLDPLLQSDTGEVIEAGMALLSRVERLQRDGGFTGVSLLGFSQGMAMAVTLLRLRPRDFTAVVGLSGFVAESELLAMAEPLADRVPFFWGRDRQDWLIHEDAVESTARWLEANTALTARTYPDMGHRIGPEEIRDVGVFLRRYIPGAAGR